MTTTDHVFIMLLISDLRYMCQSDLASDSCLNIFLSMQNQ